MSQLPPTTIPGSSDDPESVILTASVDGDFIIHFQKNTFTLRSRFALAFSLIFGHNRSIVWRSLFLKPPQVKLLYSACEYHLARLDKEKRVKKQAEIDCIKKAIDEGLEQLADSVESEEF